jgi:hypothetical protein
MPPKFNDPAKKAAQKDLANLLAQASLKFFYVFKSKNNKFSND